MGVGETVLRRPVEAPNAAAGTDSAEQLAEMMRLHQRRIQRLLLGFVRDADEADSLTQECFLRAYKNWGSFRGECSVATWLTRIAVNLARDQAKSRRRGFWRRLLTLDRAGADEGGERAIDVAADGASPERRLLAREELASVWKVVDQLPDQRRTAFLLRFVEEMSLEEVAEAMQLQVGTVKSHLSRAVGTLRKRVRR